MFGYKFVKETEIENYQSEIERLRKEVKELNEVVNAEKENNKKLYIEYCGLGETIETLERKISELEKKQVEKKPRKRITKKKDEEKTGLIPALTDNENTPAKTDDKPKTQKKKRTYKKKTEKKSE